MKLKKILFAVMLCGSMMCMLFIAYASEDRASPIFESGYVITGSDLYTEFGASTKKNVSNLYVSSVQLQEMDQNNAVVSSKSVTAPSYKVQNDSNYTAWKTYTGTSGKRYRVKAVFYADGYYITRYSNIVTYQ